MAYNCKVKSERVFRCTFSQIQDDLGVKSTQRRLRSYDYLKLCAKHFTLDQFKIHPALAKTKCGYKKLDLRSNAIPTLFDTPLSRRKNQEHQHPTKTEEDRGTLSIKHHNTD